MYRPLGCGGEAFCGLDVVAGAFLGGGNVFDLCVVVGSFLLAGSWFGNFGVSEIRKRWRNVLT